MTEFDTQALRQALHATRDPGAPVDVTEIMAQGRRLRMRRRLIAVAGGLCAVAALTGTATAIANQGAAPSSPSSPVSPAQHQPSQHQPAQHQPAQHQPAQPSPVRRRTPPPAERAIGEATPTPIPTTTVTPSPSGSTTPTALPTPVSRPAAIASATMPPASISAPAPTGPA